MTVNRISRHISYLLLTCRNVGVPGLGIFTASHAKAYYDPFDGVFYPTRIRVEFFPDIAGDSSLLLKSLKRKLDIPDEEARSLVDEFVVKVRAKIKRNGYCRLEGIGYLMENDKRILCLKDTFFKRSTYSTLSAV
ncbi:MAG: hypothetical protein J1D77_08250 [Muribaculaceae bacterium]|nr:hypothetical protein [Muribaculaceae bacterium]